MRNKDGGEEIRQGQGCEAAGAAMTRPFLADGNPIRCSQLRALKRAVAKIVIGFPPGTDPRTGREMKKPKDRKPS
jgi:hypothetical protein